MFPAAFCYDQLILVDVRHLVFANTFEMALYIGLIGPIYTC
jgi:hypothetical protein